MRSANADGVVSASISEQLGVQPSRRSRRSVSGATSPVSTVWCGPPAVSHSSAEVDSDGAGFHTARATGRFGSGSSGGDDLDLVGHQPEPVAHVDHADHGGRARVRRRTPAAPGPPGRRCPSGWISQVGVAAAMRRADLEHVRAEDLRLARPEVVGVVLHERGAARLRAGAHRLDRGEQRGGLPVALAAEAVAVGHQPLHGQARELAQPAEVLEVGGEGAEPAVEQELAQPGLDAGGVAQRRVPVAAPWPAPGARR